MFYPAIFQPEEDGSFTVTFPDVDGCITSGESMEDAYEMSFDALGLVLSYMVDNKEPIPTASTPQNINLESGQFIVVVEFDMMAYRKKYNSK